MARTNIGGSLLPSGSRETYARKTGLRGMFETRPLPDLDTHGLFFAPSEGEFAGHYQLIASHPNGFTCDELAKRIIAAWAGGSPDRALEQFDYALACGGLGVRRQAIEYLCNQLTT